MKLDQVIEEGIVFEDEYPDDVIQEGFDQYERFETLLEALQILKTVDVEKLSEHEYDVFENNLSIVEGELTGLYEAAIDHGDVLSEAVDRQFRRYGDKFLRQYRCTTGQKSGRLVTSPEKCGIRKDPRRVRIGKKASRVKKGQRIRKTLFTKRKTQSKRLTRLNKNLRGDS